ncbi:CLUMA_CG009708, isoform A [Clunio marinus]|uniref:CLUMA_CG009708, isoform A n=1 Tax=Clunio marinus TaxID=568069 RepID=A0A1J1IBD3_9DIPT|nr:CLUMA_CG009708, isoform A [Clunio marinus]
MTEFMWGIFKSIIQVQVVHESSASKHHAKLCVVSRLIVGCFSDDSQSVRNERCHAIKGFAFIMVSEDSSIIIKRGKKKNLK